MKRSLFFLFLAFGVFLPLLVILSAGASLAWLARALQTSEATLLDEAAQAPQASGRLVFLPYLSGERTPHNDPSATGVFFGLTTATTRADMTRAVLEGVAFALADGLDALEARGGRIPMLTAIGGGARSGLWLGILAAALQRPLQTVEGSDVGPALGAARLAAISSGAGTVASVCTRPRVDGAFDPSTSAIHALLPKRAIFRRLYPALYTTFSDPGLTP